MRGRTEILSSIFRRGETGFFQSGQPLIEADKVSRYIYQLRTGLAYQSHRFPDGRRAIVDIFAPGNVVGLEMILSLRASGTVTAVRRSRLFGQLPGKNKLKAWSRLVISPFPEIKIIPCCCGVL